ncbi:hypothetical protein [Actinomadura latina]|uniref:Uncharacterized protein n=1 Tax=Actinomadura latina TaxID=163603 RepID=A0A846Z0C8_9ACTN|nr:hypothetical protein [Actinomadura latina]NKZ06289.1 hypothetical protein [Actinomadura latina]
MHIKSQRGDANADRRAIPGNGDGFFKQAKRLIQYSIGANDFNRGGLYEFVAVLRMKDGSVSNVRSNGFFIS